MKNEKEPAGRVTAERLRVTAARTELQQEGGRCYILLVESGSCTISWSAGQLTAHAGSLALLGHAAAYGVQPAGRGAAELLLCTFRTAALSELCSGVQRDYSWMFTLIQPTILMGTVQDNVRLRVLLELLYSASAEPDCPGLLYLALLMHYIERLHRAASRAENRQSNDTVEHICAYLAANYQQKLTLTEVAAQFYLSPYYLSRLFRRVTGQSIVDYINARRIEAAQRLLEDTELSISSVAEQTGFSTAAHFRRVFREKMGIGPMQYRKLRRPGRG